MIGHLRRAGGAGAGIDDWERRGVFHEATSAGAGVAAGNRGLAPG
jgi:hypothetical protein